MVPVESANATVEPRASGSKKLVVPLATSARARYSSIPRPVRIFARTVAPDISWIGLMPS